MGEHGSPISIEGSDILSDVLDISKYSELDEYSKSMIYYIAITKNFFKLEKENIIEYLINIGQIEQSIAEEIASSLMSEEEIYYLKTLDNCICLPEKMGDSYIALHYLNYGRFDMDLNSLNFNDEIDVIIEKMRAAHDDFINFNINYRNIVFDKEFLPNEFSFETKYSFFDVVDRKTKEFIRMLELINNHSDSTNKNDLIKLNIKFLKEEFRNKIKLMRFGVTFLTVLQSPFYEKEKKEIVEDFFQILSRVLFNVELQSLFIEEINFIREKDVKLRGSKDKTTHIQIFFSLENMDVFCLRFDLPHKGEPYLHFNLHEIGRDSGIPLKKFEYEELLKEYVNLDNVFFEFENKYWFRNRFLEKVEQSEFEKEKKEKLKSLFKEKSHLKIRDINNNEELFLETFNQLKRILQVALGVEVKKMAKDCIDIDEKLCKIALQLKTKVSLYDYMIDNKNEKILKENCVKLLNDVYKFNIGIDEKELHSLDLVSLIDMIFDFINE